VVAVHSPEKAVGEADIVCCATSSPTPILAGRWLRPGTFVDLVGSFSPHAREADDEVVRHARLFVDTQAAAFAEAGDILDPLARGVVERTQVEGDLGDLVCGRVRGRVRADEITLFKSVGTAIEDLAAAQLIVAEATQRARR
jgi:ornithine cyclodeaminase